VHGSYFQESKERECWKGSSPAVGVSRSTVCVAEVILHCRICHTQPYQLWAESHSNVTGFARQLPDVRVTYKQCNCSKSHCCCLLSGGYGA